MNPTHQRHRDTVAATDTAATARTHPRPADPDAAPAGQPVRRYFASPTPTVAQPVCPPSTRDGDLLTRIRAGSHEAFEELYRRYVDNVTRYLSRRMRDKDPDAIPDLVQEAFCEAFAASGSAIEDMEGWLIRQAAKACTRYDWSHRRYVRAVLTTYEAAQTAAASTDDDQPGVPGRISLVHGLARLKPDQRRAVHLRYLEEFPRDVTAQLMGRTANAVKLLERRALRNLRTDLTAAATSNIQRPVGSQQAPAGLVAKDPTVDDPLTVPTLADSSRLQC
jgi:RNA polymerase sigma-70 factor, ECF subfamily